MTNALIALSIGLGLYVAAMLFILAILRMSKSTKEEDMAADDMEQAAAVSKPAPLRPHVKAGTAWGQEQ